MTKIPFILQIELILFVVLFILLIYKNVVQKKISNQYSVMWFISAFAMLICAIFPGLLGWLANKIGIATISNMLFLGGILILLIITFSLTIIVSDLRKKITTLTEELGILKKEIGENNERKNNK